MRSIAFTALAVTAALALPACGSSGSPASSASAGAAGSGSSNARYQARLKAAECFRAHGVNVPDPGAGAGTPGGGGGGEGAGAKIRQALQTPAGQAALRACASQVRRAFPFASLTPAQRQHFQQEAVKFAECMRAHNVNIPDPTSNRVGGFGIFRSIPSSERNSPAFQSALQACSSILPRRGRLSGGGGPGGAAGSVGGPGA